MSSAPALRVIEGGRGEAPTVPPAVESERLYPIFRAVGERSAFFHVVAVSLILHGVALLASVNWNILGEERVAGGSEEMVVIEGIDVILLDQMPSPPVPLAEAREIEANDIAEVTPVSKAPTVEADRPVTEVPVDRAITVAAGAPAAANDTVTAIVGPGETVNASTGKIVEIGPIPADEVAAEAVATNEVSTEVEAVPFASVEPATARAAALVRAETMPPIPAAPPVDAAPQDAVADRTAVSAPPNDRDREIQAVEATPAPLAQGPAEETTSARQAAQTPDWQLVIEPNARSPEIARAPAAAPVADDRPAQPAEDGRPVAARERSLRPADATQSAAIDNRSFRPTNETRLVVAEEVVPVPPLPRENPLEIVKRGPSAKTATASVPPRPSAAASAASPAARGPAKAKAGAGGKTKAVRGTANLSSYQSKLVAHLRRFRTYPAAARRQRLEGTASIRVTINRNGRVATVSLAKSSGHSVLDREAVAMAKRASPFPPIPAGLGTSQITIRAPIRFDIR